VRNKSSVGTLKWYENSSCINNGMGLSSCVLVIDNDSRRGSSMELGYLPHRNSSRHHRNGYRKSKTSSMKHGLVLGVQTALATIISNSYSLLMEERDGAWRYAIK
jgi:hypothetical protein